MNDCADRAIYAYAVARPFDPARLTDVRGVDGAPVGLIGDGDVVAVVSAHPRADVDEAALRSRLEDPARLEALARAHHAVVDAVAACAVTLPFRLATVHRAGGRVVELLRCRYRQLGAMLDRFAGRVELGVKVYADPDEPARSAAPGGADVVPAEPTSSSPGRDYIRRRRESTRRREDLWHQVSALAQHVDTELAALAEDRRYHRPQDPRLSGRRGENVLNVAYLVPVGGADAFVARARDLARDVAGTGVVVTGPWAPYSFAELDVARPTDDPGRSA